MNRERPAAAFNKQIIDEAAEWFVELNEGEPDIAVRRRFDAWLRTSPEHMRAYLRMLPVWEQGARLDTEVDGDPEALIAWARAGDSVVPLDERRQNAGPKNGEIPLAANVTSAHLPRSAPRRARVTTAFAAVAACVAIVAVAAFGIWLYGQRETYSTGVGEQRLLALADGSKVEVNSRSRLKVRFTDRRRDVYLLQGQALFHVARDKERPFTVYSADTRVRAVGTQFDVYRKGSGTIVTVVEGRVAVVPGPGAHAGGVETTDQFLAAGEQITLPSATPRPKPADVAVAIAWTQQRLIFSRTPLAEAAEEFNRYNTRRIVVAGGGLESFIVSGVFSSTDPASLVRFLRKQPNIQVRETDAEIRITEK